jgi:hypothetical protein
MIYPADIYNPCDDMCVITSYFNPCHYQNLLNNYLLFRDSMERSGIKLFTTECAFGDAPFQLERGENIFQVRSNAVLWQKERLLSIALEHVRDRFPKIAWIDADLFFTSANWLVDASALLNKYPLVQLFDSIIQLPQGATVYDGTGKRDAGFAAVISKDPTRLRQSYDRHGRTGLAWCARSSVLAHGIFDGCILGDSDHVMAHAMCSDWTSPCIDQTFFQDQASRAYFENWARRFSEGVTGEISFLSETILHRWHGNPENRLYAQRTRKLANFGVDPEVDLRLNADHCWEWNTKRPHLHNYVANYFEQRNDDGDEPMSEPKPT